MNDTLPLTQNAGRELRWHDGRDVHRVEGTDSSGAAVFRTRCGRNLPKGAVTDEERPVTCPVCLEAS